MAFSKMSVVICMASVTLMTGCSSLTPNQQASSYTTSVRPVMTEYSQALSCVGSLIDKSRVAPLKVYIRDIKDETVPTDFRSRRLSKGGAWWFHTAIDKMQSRRVSSLVKLPPQSRRAKMNLLILSGAWTQDDLKVGSSGSDLGLKNLGGGMLDSLGWFRKKQASVIAGDFVSMKNNQVTHASAISLAVNNSDNSYKLRIDDGSRRLDLGLSGEVNEGPQFAQRRIVEAATLVHLARAFKVDYRPCMEQQWSNPAYYQKQMRAYMVASKKGQNKYMQKALLAAGYYTGQVDGLWGSQSEKALNRFMLRKGMVASGRPSAQTYGLLIKHIGVRKSKK